MKKSSLTRREFAGSVAALGAGLLIVPRHAVAASGQTPPSEKINIAGVGVGGMGRGDLNDVKNENVVALCDVDLNRSGDTFKTFPEAKPYRDFRQMFDEMEDQIDAVTVATPDHTHAVAAMAAIRRNKHVYCQKPLAHSVHEVRQLMKAAREHNVVTQLGNQGHSFDSIRTFCEWIWDGAIGNVHTIHLGCAAVNSGLDALPRLAETHQVPPTLDWDLWLGPAGERPYHPAYLPGAWRGWVPFGNGTVGDWTCHVVDPVFWALKLGSPTSIQAEAKDYDPKTQGDAFPKGERITYEFPAKGDRGPITMYWYSGTEPIPRPADLEEGRDPVTTGAVVLGDEGTIQYGSHGAGGVRIIPEAKMKAYQQPEKTLPRGLEHHRDWLDSIRAGTKAGSDFTLYGGPLTELAMLGVIALKLPGVKLQWDAQNMQFTNSPEANQHVAPPYREGWTL
ncbi:MAG: Gfo/Idh/MocA family oxidoreductase [Planctomycetota bacterium]